MDIGVLKTENGPVDSKERWEQIRNMEEIE